MRLAGERGESRDVSAERERDSERGLGAELDSSATEVHGMRGTAARNAEHGDAMGFERPVRHGRAYWSTKSHVKRSTPSASVSRITRELGIMKHMTYFIHGPALAVPAKNQRASCTS